MGHHSILSLPAAHTCEINTGEIVTHAINTVLSYYYMLKFPSDALRGQPIAGPSGWAMSFCVNSKPVCNVHAIWHDNSAYNLSENQTA